MAELPEQNSQPQIQQSSFDIDIDKNLARTVKPELWRNMLILAKVNELQFRRLWLLAQYQLFKAIEDHEDQMNAVRSATSFIEKKLGSRQFLSYSPTRSQVLYNMMLLKMERFEDTFMYYYHIDIYQFACNAEIEELFDWDRFVSFEGRKLSLPKNVWDQLADPSTFSEIYIPLPKGLDRKFIMASSPEVIHKQKLADIMAEGVEQ